MRVEPKEVGSKETQQANEFENLEGKDVEAKVEQVGSESLEREPVIEDDVQETGIRLMEQV